MVILLIDIQILTMFKSIFLLGVERAMQALSLIFIAGLLLRGLGDENYARWQYSMAIFSTFSALTWFLGNEILTVKLFQNNNKNIVKNFFIIKFITCAVIVFFYLGYVALYGEDFLFFFFIFTFLIVLVKEPLSTLVSIYQYESRYDWVLIVNILALLVRVGSLCFFVFSSSSPYLIGLPWLLEAICFTYLIYLKSNFKIQIRKNDLMKSWVLFKKNFPAAFKVWITVVSSIFFLKFDKISLSSQLSYSEYSRYSSSSQINENVLSVIALTMNVLGPYYLYKFKDKLESIKKLYSSLMMIFVFMVFFSVAIFHFKENIGDLVFGSKKYTEYLWMLIFMTPLYGVSVVFNFFFFRHNEFDHALKKSISLLAILIFGNYLFNRYFSAIESIVFSMYASLMVCIIYDVVHFLKWKSAR